MTRLIQTTGFFIERYFEEICKGGIGSSCEMQQGCLFSQSDGDRLTVKGMVGRKSSDQNIEVFQLAEFVIWYHEVVGSSPTFYTKSPDDPGPAIKKIRLGVMVNTAGSLSF